jgi:hypothetical protein
MILLIHSWAVARPTEERTAKDYGSTEVSMKASSFLCRIIFSVMPDLSSMWAKLYDEMVLKLRKQ